MKISLAWVFDHLKGSLVDYQVSHLVDQLRSKTAEIEGVHELVCDWNRFQVGEVAAVGKAVSVRLGERKKVVELPLRDDAAEQSRYLIAVGNDGVRWATLKELGAEREGLLPAIAVADEQLAGGWRKGLETKDWILEIDNKSLTNRPDLWGHRGFAREVGALLGLSLVPEEQLCAAQPIRHYDRQAPGIKLVAGARCTRFAGLLLTDVAYQPSLLFVAHRLARLDAKPMDLFVDLTNYVMYDLGQPMHAFDAQKITGGVVVREAFPQEQLELLDGETVELAPQDCVVADEKGALSVAGIMGGRASAIGRATTHIFLESAHFDAVSIRKSSARLKKRTESSMRFEKSLDPNQNTVAIARYLALLGAYRVPHQASEAIASLGPLAQEAEMVVAHRFLIDRIGAMITEGQVRAILEKLGFGVQVIDRPPAGLSYQITVPTFRSSKDVRTPEDIVEEVARFVGYSTILPVVPARLMKPFSLTALMRRRGLKHHSAYALGMREIESYPLADESFMARLGLPRERLITIQNPLSQNWQHFATSLIPALLQAVELNAIQEEELRFFELNRAWQLSEHGGVNETPVYAGIWYRRPRLDFYEAKAALESLLQAMELVVEWRKPVHHEATWFDGQQIAELWLEGRSLGYAGMVAPSLLRKVVDAGEAFACELDASLLLRASSLELQYRQPSKYQAVVYDVSMFVPATVTVAQLEAAIVLADTRVRDVALRDRFEKPEWGGKRSVTMRYTLQDDEKTLSKRDSEGIQKAIEGALLALGVEIR